MVKLRAMLLLAALVVSYLITRYNLLDGYVLLILMYVGINIILAVSLNLINGYMGEFSVGHAGFMAIGAYVSAILTVRVFPDALAQWLFPLAVIAAGVVSALIGGLLAIPSFKTRGDYLAIVTLAFNMIVKSVLENMDSLGAARGFLGIARYTNLTWVVFWGVVTVWVVRNFVYSSFGRGVLSVREDEIAAGVCGVNTRQVKLFAFMLSAFFAGVAGGLYAHLLLFINPKMFDLIKSTEMLIMVYLGGIGSIGGSIVGAVIYTVLLELLRPLGIWRMTLMAIMLVVMMVLRPRGIMGLSEFRLLIPADNPTPGKDNAAVRD
ncbi:branched-chain amino acid ABC transporter permease [Candidatus Magnetobacterium casense]|nr:branched-chain amino acid ABC transporter permease [Candidatus Magnetobacterium casensis]